MWKKVFSILIYILVRFIFFAGLLYLFYLFGNLLLKIIFAFKTDVSNLLPYLTYRHHKFLFFIGTMLFYLGYGKDLWKVGTMQKVTSSEKIFSWVVIFIALLKFSSILFNPMRYWGNTPVNALGIIAFPPNKTFYSDTNNPYRPQIKIRTNSYGYRDQEWSLDNEFNKKRIVIIGDSYVAGIGIKEEEDLIDRCLEKELNKNSKK